MIPPAYFRTYMETNIMTAPEMPVPDHIGEYCPGETDIVFVGIPYLVKKIIEENGR